MGVCCSNNKVPKNKNNNIYAPVSTNRQDEYEELSGEIKEILETYLKHEKNSPQNKNLAESNQLKHSLEQPNTPYFKNFSEADDQFLFLKQSKQVEEITIRLPHKNSDNIPVEQAQKYNVNSNMSWSKNPTFSSRCPICNNDHFWYHDCKSEITYNNGKVICTKCNCNQQILEYEFTCQKTSEKFKFKPEQVKQFDF